MGHHCYSLTITESPTHLMFYKVQRTYSKLIIYPCACPEACVSPVRVSYSESKRCNLALSPFTDFSQNLVDHEDLIQGADDKLGQTLGTHSKQ
jgi:hypothetical protein